MRSHEAGSFEPLFPRLKAEAPSHRETDLAGAIERLIGSVDRLAAVVAEAQTALKADKETTQSFARDA